MDRRKFFQLLAGAMALLLKKSSGQAKFVTAAAEPIAAPRQGLPRVYFLVAAGDWMGETVVAHDRRGGN